MCIENSVLVNVRDSEIGHDGCYSVPIHAESVGRCAFFANKLLKTVMIPASITSIGYSAFSHCDLLENVYLQSGIKRIGEHAFKACTSLKKIIIPKGVVSLGDGVFVGCTSLEEVVLPSSITEIPTDTFNGCTSLKAITIPDTIRVIRNHAFKNCRSLEQIELPYSIVKICDEAFANCTSLRSVFVPCSVISVGCNAFAGDKMLPARNGNYKICHIDEDGRFYSKPLPYGNRKYLEPDKWAESESGYCYYTDFYDVFNECGGKINENIAVFQVETMNDIDLPCFGNAKRAGKIKLAKRLSQKEVADLLSSP